MTPQPGKPPSDLRPRVVSGIVLVAVAAFVTWLGGTVFAAAATALAAVLYYEWARMTMLPTQAFSVIWGAGAIFLAGIWLVFGQVATALWLAAGGCILLATVVHFRLFKGTSLTRTKWAIGGVAYSLAAAASLVVIRGTEPTATSFDALIGDRGLVLLAFLFLVVWATDILAYFVGRSVGGPKLMPAVSPKKTISGAVGGLFGAVLIAVCFALAGDGFSLAGTVALALVLSAVSQVGDLFESWIKRRYRVKDSSNLIPGHGGFMDRVDGLVFAAVPLALYIAVTS